MHNVCVFFSVFYFRSGGTKSVACLMNTKGEVLAEVIGSSTNPWVSGDCNEGV